MLLSSVIAQSDSFRTLLLLNQQSRNFLEIV